MEEEYGKKDSKSEEKLIKRKNIKVKVSRSNEEATFINEEMV